MTTCYRQDESEFESELFQHKYMATSAYHPPQNCLFANATMITCDITMNWGNISFHVHILKKNVL